MLALIVAKAENNCIGNHGKLPWHLSADLKHFKETTLGKPVIMGRNTFESILEQLGKPLPGRENIVVTRNTDYSLDGATVVHSLNEAVRAAGGDAFVIGGAEMYSQALPLADTLYITNVHAHIDGDAFFPDLNENEWTITSSETHTGDSENDYDYTFLTYERKSGM